MNGTVTKIYFYDALPDADKTSRKFAGRGLHVSDGWAIEKTAALSVKVTHPEFGTYLVRKVRFQIFTDLDEAALSPSEFVRMNLPDEYRDSDATKVPASILGTIENFCANLDEFLGEGLGLVLSGSGGVGKSSAAAAIAIKAKLEKRSVFWTTISELREFAHNKILYDADRTVSEFCRGTNLLVIDGVRPEESPAKDPFFSRSDLEALIEYRVTHGKSTIVTSRLSEAELLQHFRTAFEALRTKSPFLEVTGPDRRVEVAKSVAAKVLIRSHKCTYVLVGGYADTDKRWECKDCGEGSPIGYDPAEATVIDTKPSNREAVTTASSPGASYIPAKRPRKA